MYGRIGMDGWKDEWMNEPMIMNHDIWKNKGGWMRGWMDEWTNEPCIEEQGWMDERMNGWMN